MFKFLAESTTILSMRLTLGDDNTADILFERNPDTGVVERNSHQLSTLFHERHGSDGDGT